MELQNAAIRLVDADSHQQFISSSHRTSRLTDAEVAFLSVELTDLNVEFGVMRNEAIRSVEDLHVGDEIRLEDRQQQFAANSSHCRRDRQCDSDHVRLISKLATRARAHQVQLMAENGVLVEAYLITPIGKARTQPYMLFPRQFRPGERYCMIDVSEV
ncbi:hypothetical protein JQX09_24595 [Sulfitobacter pseudonitzschiae]|uniref:Uncharacterized protein n=1 Tax=Pseudosulfitobacter pseudonitzschiae TaxID=1402135 RepID=A0A9Q2NTB8_9RHOB|nr:hypothetical protein [Pseudosulfitobacter pseudonitzschiae]MBM2295099.1 hypothetical protein [Pseudosulfitobacter pseudonitzschiae]MBM2300036.1 hypothetical protein [Pseudosulfitobacter pseudonitzschiae]MBM2304937.1 hypothetical protein [Pseudosulfitobacter pseudonitzschiae]MBM2314710.1 hypothetical protein [Pseudosulfitobacter pseudonitzschiae]MBM2319618.1 hypothetical protein [Pseudosulfitobacter pseudonitzschiae]